MDQQVPSYNIDDEPLVKTKYIAVCIKMKSKDL
jgi:hypothetical protein